MAHDRHVIDGFNRDMGVMGPEQALEYYLEMAGDWEDPNPAPVIVEHEGIRVVRDDLIVGTKARAGDLVVARAPSDTLVYVQPRVGLAGLSILECAARHGKRVVLFMPASRQVSHHQACCIERGAEPIFKRIAAMPNLNKAAAEWALDNDAYFIPLGLRHPLATAALVKVATGIKEPDHAVCAISTGVLSRALQIAWPNAEFTSVAVSRNLQAGELGRSKVRSHPLPFNNPERECLPPFPSVDTYDAKAWLYARDIKRYPAGNEDDVLFWNVGKEPVLQDETIFNRVDSHREWERKSDG